MLELVNCLRLLSRWRSSCLVVRKKASGTWIVSKADKTGVLPWEEPGRARCVGLVTDAAVEMFFLFRAGILIRIHGLNKQVGIVYKGYLSLHRYSVKAKCFCKENKQKKQQLRLFIDVCLSGIFSSMGRTSLPSYLDLACKFDQRVEVLVMHSD